MAVVDPSPGAAGRLLSTTLPPNSVIKSPRKGGQLWHRELLRTNGPEEVVLSEFPVKYVVGSGAHSRTYVVEADGFLIESPVTWYESRKAWDMSPGYHGPDQIGFQRPVMEGCLYCHAGRSEAIRPTVNRMRLDELALGCERCHGPASLHVERQKERQRLAKGPTGETDYTIVNPAHLSRDLAEAVCQQCHSERRSHRAQSRPETVGFSSWVCRCKTSSRFMCTTEEEHSDDGGRPRPADALEPLLSGVQDLFLFDLPQPSWRTGGRGAHGLLQLRFVRAVTNQNSAGCDPSARRSKESPDNNCVQCHMPRSKTDIPHLAFTHHRVGIHDAPTMEPKVGSQAAKLKPFLDLRGPATSTENCRWAKATA